jgi:small subunit ribosomal protein S11
MVKENMVKKNMVIKKKVKLAPKNSLNLEKKKSLDNTIYPSKKGVMHIKRSFNNTIITLTDINGNTKAYCSCGSVGFKGTKRSSKFAGLTTAEHIGRKSRNLGYKHIMLNFKGAGKGRFQVIKGLKKSRIRIKEIKEVTSFAHNGCRSKKLRRV